MTTLNPATARRLLDMLAGITPQDPMIPNAGPYETAHGLCLAHPNCIGEFVPMLTADHMWSSEWVQEGHIPLADIVASLEPAYSQASGEQLVEALKRLFPAQPGSFLPLDLFDFMAAHRPQSSFEPVILREQPNGTIQVLLWDRPEGSNAYAGACQLPGAYRLTGESAPVTLDRIMSAKIGTAPAEYTHLGVMNNPFEERGHCEHHIMLVTATHGEPSFGWWANPAQLPDNLILHHLPMIYFALQVRLGARRRGFWEEYRPVSADDRQLAADRFHGDLADYPPGHPTAARLLMVEMGEREYWAHQIAELLRGAGQPRQS